MAAVPRLGGGSVQRVLEVVGAWVGESTAWGRHDCTVHTPPEEQAWRGREGGLLINREETGVDNQRDLSCKNRKFIIIKSLLLLMFICSISSRHQT